MNFITLYEKPLPVESRVRLTLADVKNILFYIGTNYEKRLPVSAYVYTFPLTYSKEMSSVMLSYNLPRQIAEILRRRHLYQIAF